MTEKRSKELIPNILYSSTEIPERFLQASRKWIWNQLETGVSPRQHVALSLGRMQQVFRKIKLSFILLRTLSLRLLSCGVKRMIISSLK